MPNVIYTKYDIVMLTIKNFMPINVSIRICSYSKNILNSLSVIALTFCLLICLCNFLVTLHNSTIILSFLGNYIISNVWNTVPQNEHIHENKGEYDQIVVEKGS